MKRNIPVLTITLQIPLVPGIDAQDILEALAQTLNEALDQVREQADAAEDEQETDEVTVGPTAVSPESLEPYSEETATDILALLGYPPET